MYIEKDSRNMKKTTVLVEVMRGDVMMFVECDVHVMSCHVTLFKSRPLQQPRPRIGNKYPVPRYVFYVGRYASY